MIVAKKNRSFEHLFNLFNRFILKQSFHSIQLRITAKAIDRKRPTVYFVNHSNWWDALLAFQLNYSIMGQQAYGLMSEAGLKQYRFFRKLGVYSVNRHSLRDVKISLDYSVELLRTSGNALWIFPQGDVYHQDHRPLHFLPGLGYLFEKCADVQWVPVTFYFSFGLVRKPDIYIEMGAPLTWDFTTVPKRTERLAHAQEILTAQLNQVKQDVIHGRIESFQRIWQGMSPFKKNKNTFESYFL